MRNCGKLATYDAVLVFNNVNVRSVKKKFVQMGFTLGSFRMRATHFFYNRRIAAADSAAQELTKLDRREILRDKLHKRR
jgi:hypothetical protein